MPWDFIFDREMIEINTDGVLDRFNIVVPVYKNCEELKETVQKVSQDSIGKTATESDEIMWKAVEKFKICTLTIPVNIDKKIFKDSMVKTIAINKTINTEIGDLIVEKLESSISRTKVYFKMDNPNICKLFFESFNMIDENTNEYYYPVDNNLYYDLEQNPNEIVVELKGGITDISNLRLYIGKIGYIKKDDRYVYLDLEKKEIQNKNFGVGLKSIDENEIVLFYDDARTIIGGSNDDSILSCTPNFEDKTEDIPTVSLRWNPTKAKNNIIKFEVFESEHFKIVGCDVKLKDNFK